MLIAPYGRFNPCYSGSNSKIQTQFGVELEPLEFQSLL